MGVEAAVGPTLGRTSAGINKAEDAGLLGQTMDGVQVDGEWRVAGSGSSRPGPCQQLAADPIQLPKSCPPRRCSGYFRRRWPAIHVSMARFAKSAIAWQHLLSAPCFGALFKTIIPVRTKHAATLTSSQHLKETPLVGFQVTLPSASALTRLCCLRVTPSQR